MEKEWFASWFDTNWYHLLYQHRDHSEARKFIETLLHFLKPENGSRALDLACGKGRHSVILHENGLQVKGVDLSSNSIQHAKQFERIGLSFDVHDMRTPLNERFEFIFSLFTSFGYFETEDEDQQVLASVSKMLVPNGCFVLDYLNPQKAINQMIHEEEKVIGDVSFKINKQLTKENIIRKDITVIDAEGTFDFHEQVRAYRSEHIIEMAQNCGLNTITIFGNYQLQPYEIESSDRMIFLMKKIA
jgi:cyclopropane fatty-acyl-phospholipid synthase-like methyltransferase